MGHDMTKKDGIDDQIDLARRMHKAGVSWKAISDVTCLSIDTLRRRIEPGYSAHRNKLIAERRKALSNAGEFVPILNFYDRSRVKPEDAIRVLSSIPKDTRRFFSRLMGDPLPGRSALDRKGISTH